MEEKRLELTNVVQTTKNPGLPAIDPIQTIDGARRVCIFLFHVDDHAFCGILDHKKKVVQVTSIPYHIRCQSNCVCLSLYVLQYSPTITPTARILSVISRPHSLYGYNGRSAVILVSLARPAPTSRIDTAVSRRRRRLPIIVPRYYTYCHRSLLPTYESTTTRRAATITTTTTATMSNKDNNSDDDDDDDDNNNNNNHKTIVEGSAKMCYPADQESTVFYNPVQVQNRDLSILMITLFAEQHQRAQTQQRRQEEQRKNTSASTDNNNNNKNNNNNNQQQQQQPQQTESPRKETQAAVAAAAAAAAADDDDNNKDNNGITILEALAASGLRSIRYWNEIPHVRHVTINDLELAAVERAHTNIKINNLQQHLLAKNVDVETVPVVVLSSSSSSSGSNNYNNNNNKNNAATTKLYRQQRPTGIRINHGDATHEMYISRRSQRKSKSEHLHAFDNNNNDPQRPQWDVIDLDPYGSASPFLDAAVQSIQNKGLLCITCTDMAALGGSHPETCYGRYTSMPIPRAGYLQELALRVLLYAAASSAARYGRTIHPILSVGMDFYVRVFLQVKDDKAGVNNLSLSIGHVYQSTQCPSFHIAPTGQMGGKKGNVYQPGRAPSLLQCTETGSAFKVAGPIWLGPLHDKEYITEALARLESKDTDDSVKPAMKWISTKDRLRGLLMSCLEELDAAPLFYKLPDLAKAMQCSVPPLLEFKAGLVNAGYEVSGYHKDPLAVKTNAPDSVVWDVMRAWYKKNKPIKDPPEGSVAQKIISKESSSIDVNFTIPESLRKGSNKRVARFPKNPQANWGPKSKASGHKRKADLSPEP